MISIRARLAGAVAAAGFAAILGVTGCGGSRVPAPPAGESGTAAPADGESPDPNRVRLAPDAIRGAGISTETIHPAPFAETLSLPSRLSPTPETPEEIEARLTYEAAESRFRRASVELERVRKLAADNVIASKTVQAAEADLAQARVERLRAEAALRNLGIDAAREASFPAGGAWALADVYEPQLSRVKPGARVWLRVESFPDQIFDGRIVALARFLKPQTRTLTARILVEDPQHRLRPQELATAEVEVARRTALSVPTSSLLYEGTERILFVKRGDAFEKVRVRAGVEQAGRAEILEGIADGDEVVSRGAQLLLGEMFKTRIPSDEEN